MEGPCDLNPGKSLGDLDSYVLQGFSRLFGLLLLASGTRTQGQLRGSHSACVDQCHTLVFGGRERVMF